MKKLIGIMVVLSLISGCAAVDVKLNPGMKYANNDKYTIYLNPTGKNTRGYYTAFALEIHNKTTSDIELIWDKTNYIANGQTNGGFMFDGIIFKDRNNPKQPDVIFAQDKFQKIIWPNNLVEFERGWYHRGMGLGDNGIYLTLKVNGQEIKEKLLISMTL